MLAQSLDAVQTEPPLAPVLRPGTNCVVWQRRLAPTFKGALAELLTRPSFDHRSVMDVANPDCAPLLTDLPPSDARAFLLEDIPKLAGAFGTLLGRKHVHARFGLLRGDSCRKFHADHVTLRMLCTYAGPGTEWIPDSDLVRENLGRVDVDIPTANRLVLRCPDAVQHCPVGDVIVLKGHLYDGNRGQGAVHRSPPIAAQGLSRLVLTLDEHPCGC